MASLFDWLKRRAAPTPPVRDTSSTIGALVYAIGDIHGQADLLDILLKGLVVDAHAAMLESPEIGRPIFITLGDYVDRGSSSAAVIETLIALSQVSAFDVRCLKGNHEAALLKFLDHAESGRDWASWGGGETLAAYGVQAPANNAPPEDWEAARLSFTSVLPDNHLAFIENLQLHTQVGDYVFVHAGVKPDVPIELQQEEDLLWIREEFLGHQSPSPLTVVHGHTPTLEPELHPHRIGIDTGAYATGILSAIRLRDKERLVCRADRS